MVREPGPPGATSRWLVRTYALFTDTAPIVGSTSAVQLDP
jgi:hypothetical protein